jgi:N6-L-threonylcarbamoyladenine synthase
MSIIILGIETSCDDTSAAVIKDEYILSNITANQEVHKKYGGVVPELASRAHQQHVIPVVDTALKEAGISKNDLSAIAFTRGPGLLGSLLVGTSFAKGLSQALNIPLIDINHLHGHVLAHFIKETGQENRQPEFPFLCLLVSGGHSQIIIMKNFFDFEVIGNTIDDASGEAFDKSAKLLGLPYPGGPLIDKYAKNGNPNAFEFAKPKIPGYDYSFSGLKTSILYFLRDKLKKNPNFIEKNMHDLCASIQQTIIDILTKKLILAVRDTGIKEVTIAGGVSANSGLRETLTNMANKKSWNLFIPKFSYTTDNAAMIAITGYYKYLNNAFSGYDITPEARLKM